MDQSNPNMTVNHYEPLQCKKSCWKKPMTHRNISGGFLKWTPKSSIGFSDFTYFFLHEPSSYWGYPRIPYHPIIFQERPSTFSSAKGCEALKKVIWGLYFRFQTQIIHLEALEELVAEAGCCFRNLSSEFSAGCCLIKQCTSQKNICIYILMFRDTLSNISNHLHLRP